MGNVFVHEQDSCMLHSKQALAKLGSMGPDHKLVLEDMAVDMALGMVLVGMVLADIGSRT